MGIGYAHWLGIDIQFAHTPKPRALVEPITLTDDPSFVLRLDRDTVSMWLVSNSPVRWGPREQAMLFKSKGEARRAAQAVGIKGAWSIQEA